MYGSFQMGDQVVQKVPSHSPPLELGEYVGNEYIKTSYVSAAIYQNDNKITTLLRRGN